jgi:hypothetical protein
MPSLAAISKIDFPFNVDQQEVKQFAGEFFALSISQVEKMLSAFPSLVVKKAEPTLKEIHGALHSNFIPKMVTGIWWATIHLFSLSKIRKNSHTSFMLKSATR